MCQMQMQQMMAMGCDPSTMMMNGNFCGMDGNNMAMMPMCDPNGNMMMPMCDANGNMNMCNPDGSPMIMNGDCGFQFGCTFFF